MNYGLIWSLGLIGYAVYTFVQTKNVGGDQDMVFWAKVAGGSVVGAYGVYSNITSVLRQFKEFQKSQNPKEKIIEKQEEKSPEEEQTMSEPDLSVTELEQKDYEAIMYLTKRAKYLNSENALKLLKEINNEFFDIHKAKPDEKA